MTILLIQWEIIGTFRQCLINMLCSSLHMKLTGCEMGDRRATVPHIVKICSCPVIRIGELQCLQFLLSGSHPNILWLESYRPAATGTRIRLFIICILLCTFVSRPTDVRSISFGSSAWKMSKMIQWVLPENIYSLVIFRSHSQKSRSNCFVQMLSTQYYLLNPLLEGCQTYYSGCP